MSTKERETDTLPEVLIHIGTHKTGTTSIQYSLQQNREKLKAEGLIYLPRFPRTYELQMLQWTDDALVDDCHDYLSTLIDKEARDVRGCVRFLMSSELFCGDPAFGYQNAGVVAVHLKRIFEGFNVKIIVYLRRQDEFLQSMYTQFIHQGSSISIDRFLADLPDDAFNWYRLLANYQDQFGRNSLIVRTYDSTRLHDSATLLNEFARICDIGPEHLKVSSGGVEKNNGYTPLAIEIARACNGKLYIQEQGELRELLQSKLAKAPLSAYSLLSIPQRVAICNKYFESNTKVFNEFIQEDISPWYVPGDAADILVKLDLAHDELFAALSFLLVGRHSNDFWPEKKRVFFFVGLPSQLFNRLPMHLLELGLQPAYQAGSENLNDRLLRLLKNDKGQLPSGWLNSVAVFTDIAPSIEKFAASLRQRKDTTYFICDPGIAITQPLWQSLFQKFNLVPEWVFCHSSSGVDNGEYVNEDFRPYYSNIFVYLETASKNLSVVKPHYLNFDTYSVEPLKTLKEVVGHTES